MRAKDAAIFADLPEEMSAFDEQRRPTDSEIMKLFSPPSPPPSLSLSLSLRAGALADLIDRKTPLRGLATRGYLQ
jgi:hypothetical protein